MTQEQLIDDTAVSETPSWPTLRHAIATIKDAEAALEGVIETCRADIGIHTKINSALTGARVEWQHSLDEDHIACAKAVMDGSKFAAGPDVVAGKRV